MRKRLALVFTLIAVFVLSGSASAAPLSILWDDSHDLDGDELALPIPSGGTLYSELAAFVAAAGHTITENDLAAGSLTSALLADYDVLMIVDAETAFQSAEITAIHSFVAGGGLLFMAGEATTTAFNRTSYNAVLSTYGVTFTTATPGLDLVTFAAGEPLTAGLTVIDFQVSGALLVSTTIPGAKTLGSTSAGNVGYAYGANGRVLVMSDSDPFTDTLMSPGDDEELALSNMLAHFAALSEVPPPPTPTPTSTPTETPIVVPTSTPTPTATPTSTSQPTATPTQTPSVTPTQTPSSVTVEIDVKPGETTNAINPKSNGVTSVAILTTSVADGDTVDFDPWDALDETSIRFGPYLAKPDKEAEAIDVDSDGDLDMSLQFRTQQIGITCSTTQLGISAKTWDEVTVIGSDAIMTPGCSGSPSSTKR